MPLYLFVLHIVNAGDRAINLRFTDASPHDKFDYNETCTGDAG